MGNKCVLTIHSGSTTRAAVFGNRLMCYAGAPEVPISPYTVRLKFSNPDFDPRTDYPSNCTNCGGKGKYSCYYCKGTGLTACTDCNGSGMSEICPTCNGYGYYNSSPCPTCNTKGYVGGVCATCNGTGNDGTTCSSCSGTGIQRYSCYYCGGTGQRSGETCTSCNGQGYTEPSCYYCNGSGKNGHIYPESMTITPVPGSASTYDFTYQGTDWSNMFAYMLQPTATSPTSIQPNPNGTFELVGSDLEGVTTVNGMFQYSGMTSASKVVTPNATNFEMMFIQNALLENVPEVDMADGSSTGAMFYNCVSVKEGAQALYESVKDKVTSYSYYSQQPMFYYCGYHMDGINPVATTDDMLAELLEIPDEWGGLKLPVMTKTLDGWWVYSYTAYHIDYSTNTVYVHSVKTKSGGISYIYQTPQYTYDSTNTENMVFEDHRVTFDVVGAYGNTPYAFIQKADDKITIGMGTYAYSNVMRGEVEYAVCPLANLVVEDFEPFVFNRTSSGEQIYLGFRTNLQTSKANVDSESSMLGRSSFSYDSSNYISDEGYYDMAYAIDGATEYTTASSYNIGRIPITTDLLDGNTHRVNLRFTCRADGYVKETYFDYKLDFASRCGEPGIYEVVSAGDVIFNNMRYPFVTVYEDGTVDASGFASYTSTHTATVGEKVKLYAWKYACTVYNNSATAPTLKILRFPEKTIEMETHDPYGKVISVESWDGLENCTNLHCAFNSSAVASIPAEWDLPSAVNVDFMFQRCTSLTSIPASFVGIGQEGAELLNAMDMFYGCTALGDVNVTDFGNITVADYMFSYINGINTVSVSGIRNMASMRYIVDENCGATELNISDVYCDPVGLFKKGDSVTLPYTLYQTVTTVNVDNIPGVSSLDYAFDSCMELKTVTITGENNTFTSMFKTFDYCKKLETVSIEGNGHVTSMDYAFSNCQALKSVTMDTVPNVTTLQCAFQLCHALPGIPQFLLDTDFVAMTDVYDLFFDCYKIASPNHEVLSLYNKLSALNPTSHNYAFYTYGDIESTNTDRASIPESWGGTLAS